MAKTKKSVTNTAPKNDTFLNSFSLDKIIPEKWQTPIYILVILLTFYIYFSPMYFGDKTYQSTDITTSKATRTFVDNDREQFTLWFPYIFGGMPAYVINTDYKWFNFLWVGLQSVRDVFTAPFSVDYSMWTFYLFVMAVGMYFLINYLTRNKLLALLAAFATSFSTGIIMFLFIGHVTKLTALGFYPFIFLLLLQLREKFSILKFALLIIALNMSFQGWHVQVIYYMTLAVGIYFAYNIIRSLILKNNDDIKKFLRTGAVYAAAYLIALSIQSDNLTQVYEYNPYSTRGSESILDKQQGKDTKKADSDFYQYATNWSFSPGELMTFVVPSYYGFGNSVYEGPLTQNRPTEVNTYFGQMPFVDNALYMGGLVFLLALFGLYSNYKKPYVQFLGFLSLVAILLSFGRTFPLFYDLMFNYFPYFDKFRVPSMILILVHMSVPVLAAFGLKSIIDLRKESNKANEQAVKYSLFAFGGIFLIMLVGGSFIESWFQERMLELAQTYQPRMVNNLNALKEYVSGMFLSDALIVFGTATLTFLLAYLYVKKIVSRDILLLAVVVFVMFDLVRVSHRAGKMDNAQNTDNMFVKPDYVEALEQINLNEPYRIFNMKQDGSMGSMNNNHNFNSYYLQQDFYGYSSVKPRTYQDYVDVVGLFNPTLWRMMNVKFLVTDKAYNSPGLRLMTNNKNTYLYNNLGALPRAYFVDSTAVMDNYQFLLKVKANDFDPRVVAFTHDTKLDIDKPDSTANVNVTSYKDEKIEITANASGNNLMFLGDTYYPNGWHAYIDGEETEIYRLNHGFRGIIVPKGKHKIVFEYLPQSFLISKYLSLSLSTLTIVLLVFGLYKEKYLKQNK